MKEVQAFIYNFVKEHLSEFKFNYEDFAFENPEDLLNQIKEYEFMACYTLEELMTWGFDKNYNKEFIAGHIDLNNGCYKIYKFPKIDNYFCIYDNEFREVIKKEMIIYKFELK